MRSSFFLIFLTGFAFAADIQLSPTGPISTPQAARDAARQAPKPVKIIVAGGVYPIAEALALSAEDSQVTWEAAPNAKPVFSGGKTISGWKPVGGGLWKTEIPEVAEGKWYFQQLWINGRRATRARTPNKGFFRMETPASSLIFPSEKPDDAEWEKSLRYQAFTTSAETFAELNKAAGKELEDVTLIIPHTWDVHQYRVKQLNSQAKAVLLQGPKIRELLVNEPDGRFYVENYRAALDAPGEWYLSRSGELFYQALPDEDMSKAQAVAPVAERLLKIDGAKDIAFKKISFQHQERLLGPNGFGDSQAAQSLGGALEIDQSERISFDQCEVAHIATYGIYFHLGNRVGSVTNSHLHDLGAGGIRMGTTSKGNAPENVTSFITVNNNIIQHGGRIFPDAIGVFVGHSSDNVVTHNDIGNFYYSGISSGWSWGYAETVSHRNRYENNHIHHLGWGFTSDMGGFYNLGVAFGTVVRGNHIHNVSSYRYGGWGLYTDEGSTNVLMENNLVHDTSESSFHQHYGYYNTVRNNIFAFGGKAQIQRSRNERHLSFVFEKNIVVWNPETKFLDGTKYNWSFNEKYEQGYPQQNSIMRKNIYWPIGGKMPDLIAENWTWESWRKEGRDAGSIIADPLFENIDKRDFRLKSQEITDKIGFKPWDLTVAGVRRDGPDGPAWRELAEKAVFPNWEQDSKPFPARIYGIPLANFEFAANNTLPVLSQSLALENKGDSIGVTDEVSSPIPVEDAKDAPSKRSLKVQDAAGLSKTYLPIFGISPKWEAGEYHLAFDIMAQTGADWFHEMRTSGGGEFGAGPYIAWRNGKLTAGVNGKTALAEIPAGEWFRIEISATTGAGKWTVNLTRQDGSKQEFKDLECKPSWDKCEYVLWSALADANVAFFIDNLRMNRK